MQPPPARTAPAAPVRPETSQDEVHWPRAQRAARRLRLRPGRPGQRQRQLGREVHRRLQPAHRAGGAGWRWRPNRGAETQEEAETVREGRASLRGESAETGGQRAGAGPHAQREHGLHGAPHAHPHRAGRQEAVQDRDAAPGLQLHLTPGQRAAAGGRLPGRTALPPLPEHPARARGAQRGLSQTHLHLLPQQPEEAGEWTPHQSQIHLERAPSCHFYAQPGRNICAKTSPPAMTRALRRPDALLIDNRVCTG